MLKWLKYILGIAILTFLIWYLAGHWQQVRVLLKLSAAELIIIYFVCFVGTLNNAVIVTAILKPMGTKVLFGDMVLLQNACVLLNYVPMKFGTLFMANYLKRHYGLKYSHFGTFSIFLTLLITFVACFSGAIIMIFVYGLNSIQKQILTVAFLICSAASVFAIFIPLPIPSGSSKIAIIIKDFLLGRRAVRGDMKSLSKAAVFLFFNFVITSVRLAVIYYSMDIKIHPAGFLVLGALGYIVLFINFTPGALGIREAVLGAGAAILGIPLEIGIVAALVDRAITLSWAFVVGGVCAGWLWHKTPADFKETTNNA